MKPCRRVSGKDDKEAVMYVLNDDDVDEVQGASAASDAKAVVVAIGEFLWGVAKGFASTL